MLLGEVIFQESSSQVLVKLPGSMGPGSFSMCFPKKEKLSHDGRRVSRMLPEQWFHDCFIPSLSK